jgi:hypothetical protein
VSNFHKLSYISIGLLWFVNTANAQFGGSNIAEYQYGRMPNDTVAISTLYNRLVGFYAYKHYKASATLEQFNTPLVGSNYVKVTQFLLQYKLKPLEIKVGNFYETIGRGSMLRSFEIPGAVLEDLSYRSRQYFNRDIFGASARFQRKNFIVKALYGSPLNYVFPPTQDVKNRRSDTIAAVYSEYTIKNQTFGASAMKHSNSGNDKVFAMATASGNISQGLSYYTEVLKNVSDFAVDDFSNQSSYAIYGGVNLSLTNLGLSVEYKNYKNFLIGSGINEPPALIREHSYRLLNRSTHVLQPQNETGYQIELFYTFPNLSTLTFNNSLAVNSFGKEFVYHEYFIGYDFALIKKHDMKVFADYASDPFKLQENRVSAGMSTDWKLHETSAFKTEYEFQIFNRSNEIFQNHVLVLGYAFKSKLICNIVTEFSNDSFIVTNDSKIWFGGNIKYQLNKSNNLQVFAGERRGGPACNAGVCYEVLDFKGVEVRFTTRF